MTIFPNSACTRCGCVCDDLTLHVRDNRIQRVENACVLAEDWFLQQNSRPRPAALIADQPVPLQEAIQKASELLSHSRAPLIYGLGRSTTEGQRLAIQLAEQLGAIVDTAATLEQAQTLLALQQVGESTCSLGEVRNRADLVIYWGTNPVKTHPRHLERYGNPTEKRRTVVVVDCKETETTALADRFLQIKSDQDWEMLWKLRMRLASPDSPELERAWEALVTQMKSAKFGVIFFGNGITKAKTDHRTVEALLQLVTDLNAHTRFYARRMRGVGDVAGADSVLTWTTGYPLALNMQRGYPRYNPVEYSASELLAKKQVDLCLMMGSEATADFPQSALATLREIPVITLDVPEAVTDFVPAVRFTTATYGIHRPGTAYRMDEVPIPLRTILETDYPSDAEVLQKLLEASKK
jgi:formylmethanofuran dehydrogenase subunit B